MDLSEVKKVIKSILNLCPTGIFVDKIDAEFKLIEGCKIPWGKFGYTSLLPFLKHELAGEIRIDDSDSWNIKLYSIANDKSGHILQMRKDPRRMQ